MKFSRILKLLAPIALVCIQSCTQNKASQISPTQKEIKIGGSAETYELLEDLAETYRETNKNIEFAFLPNSQTSGGIQGVKDNIMDIGAVGRSPYAEERSSAIEYRALAQNALVIVAHQSIGNVNNLTTEQLQGIYRGEIKNWQEVGGENAPIVPIDIPEDESEKKLLREHHLGKNLQITEDAILLTDEAQALEAISTTEYSIGAIPLSEELAELSLNILSLDGIEPTRENLENGRYKMAQTLGIVFSPESQTLVRDFIDFVLSEEGKEVIEEFEDDD
ncbi:MAG: substrate-binding domain-containing protein [Cyanobacteria bacterium SBLK]|nr:substrate-binding domain-containing protein [Cyanobacteria bacterium SBLK]